ncbi:hypothetical protein [Paenibacillus sp. NPDC058071]|uniref:hypothetical protein n=1 Tax=Paenibacillus sp. NPDC058071 TaxID=3346326 RepID=UPI0036DAE905
MIFERISEKSLEVALQIVNSNPTYNTYEDGNPSRPLEEVRSEFINPDSESYFIVHDDRPIGIIDFLQNNPKDNCPWLGLLMIHGDYRSLGSSDPQRISSLQVIKH